MLDFVVTNVYEEHCAKPQKLQTKAQHHPGLRVFI